MVIFLDTAFILSLILETEKTDISRRYFVEKLHKLFDGDYISLAADTKKVDSIREMAEKYRLLPSDALIAATCKHHNLKRIATFDSDFDRVDFLEIITPEES